MIAGSLVISQHAVEAQQLDGLPVDLQVVYTLERQWWHYRESPVPNWVSISNGARVQTEDDPTDGSKSPGSASAHRVSRRGFLGSAAALIALAGCTTSNEHLATAGPQPSVSPTSGSITSPAVHTPSTRAPDASTGRTTPVRPSPRGPAREVMRGSGARPQVALTFHGAGDPGLAKSILSAATSAHAAVTVMAVGVWIQANPLIVKQIQHSGHELGNHTWSHPVLRDLDRTQVRGEIDRCRDALDRLSGSPGRWFRQSGSQHSTPLIRELAGAAGYPVCVSYDIDSLDWTDPGPAAIVRNVSAATAGSIVSLHLGHPGTFDALPQILRALAARGLRAVTLTELLAA